MKVETLMKELQGESPIAALDEFNTFLEESSDQQGILHGLLLSSRRCNEILGLLEAEKRPLGELATIYTTLGHVLLNIAGGELSEYNYVGLHISQQVLHNNERSLYKLLLSSSSNRATKSVLRCLTGMVMCGGEAANEVLATLNWEKVNLEFIATRQSARDVYDVRAWCIYLVLAFLNSSEEPNLTKQFLLKKDVLPAIFSGLKFDPCERVINVLRVMHKSILLNPSITKTMKLNLFTPGATRHLLDLYQWMGPIGKMAKGGDLNDLASDLKEEVLRDREQVTQALQEFMMTFCGSTTQGIIFKEKIQSGPIKSNNWYAYKILSHLKTPWESEGECELMSTILGKCPDLLKTYMPTLRSSLTPRPTKAFVSLMKMVTRIIDRQTPWVKIESQGPEGAVGCLVPQPLISPYFKSLLESFYSPVRFSGLTLLLSILNKTKETIEFIKTSKELLPEVKRNAQEKILKMVFKVLRLDHIVSCWEISVGDRVAAVFNVEESSIPDDVKEPDKITELLSIAKVLTLFNELQPNKVLHKAFDPVKMLDALQRLPENSIDSTDNSKAKLELQVLCLELLALVKEDQEIVLNSATTEGDYRQNFEENIIYKLISTYAQSANEMVSDEDEHLRVVVTEKCQKVLSTALAKLGLPAHYDGSIKFWLRHVTGKREAKLASFLTRVIHGTVSSLHQYTDTIIRIATSAREHDNEGQIASFMDNIATMEVEDNKEVTSTSISLPFSRLVLAAVDLLEGNPDSDYIEYFSKVITDYQYSVNDPELLTAYLLQNERILTVDLVEYLKSCCHDGVCNSGMDSSGGGEEPEVILNIDDNPSLSATLKYLFMTSDLATTAPLLEKDNLKEILCTKDLDLIILQLLLYIQLRSARKKGRNKVLKKFVESLRNIYLLLEKHNPVEALHLIQTVLEHPRILAGYRPFSAKKTPVTDLTSEFIIVVLKNHPDLSFCTVPYFSVIMRYMESSFDIEDGIDYWHPISPFITSTHTVVSYKEAERMLMTCLMAPPFSSDSLETLIVELAKLITETTSAKRRLAKESVELLVHKFLEWGQEKEQKSPSQRDTLRHMEALLIRVLSAPAIEQFTSGNLKSLLHCQPPCPDLCCHLARQHPQHSHTFAKYLKKHGTLLPSQAPLLALLLKQDEVVVSSYLCKALLLKVLEPIREWLLDISGPNDATSVLIPHVLKEELLDEDTMSEVCRKLYEEIVIRRQPPPKKLLSLLPLFDALAKTGPHLTRFSLPDEQLSLLHICLSCVRTAYQKENQDTDLLLSIVKLIIEAVPKIREDSLRSSLSTSKIWSSFVKQVLRVGISDPHLGPDMIQALTLVSSVLYAKSNNFNNNTHCDNKESGITVPITTLYQMVMGHSHYLTLMFSEEDQWERLKERVIELQQTLVDCEDAVCQESHVPVLLGAYGASMSIVDQRILKLLFCYERKGFMSTYQPVLWGKTAVVHFGVKSQNLGIFKDPLPEQVVGLLNMDKIIHTCYNFNTRLPLEPTEIYKEDKTVYDIRFLLPLMLYLADEDRLSEIDYAECGAVVLGFIALTSHQREVWGIGAAILRCMVDMMENSRRRRLSLPWFWMVGVVSCAINGRYRRLPALTTHFLIQATQLLSQPEHPLYHIVLNYVFLKPDFKIYFVPELYRLYNSAHVTDSKKHRAFLLSILSSGIRQIVDYKICRRSFTATLMMGMLQAPTADTELKSQVLEVLEAMVRIPLGAVELVRQHSLLTVLPSVLSVDGQGVMSNHLILLSSVVKVVSALWATLFESTTRKVIIATDLSLGNSLDEQEGIRSSNSRSSTAKRRATHDANQGRAKRKKVDTKKDAEASDVEVISEDEENVPKDAAAPPTEKLLPPLFVHEFLNTLMLLLPIITANSPLSTLSTFLHLVSQVVQYVERVAELSSEKQRIRLAALAPHTIKEQVFSRVQWSILHHHLQEYLTDDEEVHLLGSKSEESLERWRCEPLSVALRKLRKNEPDSERDCAGLIELKDSVLNLLKVLEK